MNILESFAYLYACLQNSMCMICNKLTDCNRNIIIERCANTMLKRNNNVDFKENAEEIYMQIANKRSSHS